MGRPLAGLISTRVSFFGLRPDRRCAELVEVSSVRAVTSLARAGTAALVDFAVFGDLSGLLVFLDELAGFFVVFISHGFLSTPKASVVWIEGGFGMNFEFLAVDIRST